MGLRRPLRWAGCDPGASRAAFAASLRTRLPGGVFEEKTEKGNSPDERYSYPKARE